MTYNEFIQDILDTRGQWTIPECGVWENHHIIPLCVGGEPENYNHFTVHENMIWLAPHEHFIAHRLLYEENKDNYDLNYAYWRLANDGNHLVTPEEYEEAKIAYSSIRSSAMKQYWSDEVNSETIIERNKKISLAVSGDNNPSKQPGVRQKIAEANSKRIWTKESRKKMSDSKKGHHDNVGIKMPDYAKEKISKATSGVNNPRARLVKCIETGEVFGCMNDAIKKYLLNKKTLRKACLTGILYKGYHWEYVDKK